MVRFVHTADWHLGRRIGNVPDEGNRQWLWQQRFDAVRQIGALIAAEGAQFVVVAGDLFESHEVDDRTVSMGLEVIAGLRVPVLAIPGNHDFARCGPQGVWQRPVFRHQRPDNFVLLDDPEVPCSLVPAGPGGTFQAVAGAVPGAVAVVLPAPLLRRHQTGNTCAHLTAGFGTVAGEAPVRIGLAHGSVQDFTQSGGEGDAINYLVPQPIVAAGELDYLALGDWHGAQNLQVAERAWYSGTPEPTQFGQANSGQVHLVTIDHHTAAPRVESRPVARSSWEIIRPDTPLLSADDIANLRSLLAAGSPLSERLIRLEVGGSLPLASWPEWEQVLEQCRNTCRRFDHNPDEVRLRLDVDDLEAWCRDRSASLEEVLLRLLTDLAKRAGAGDEQAPVARRALLLLIDLIEARDAVGGTA